MALARQTRHDVQKKTGHAAEQEREDVKAKRQAWFDNQEMLDPKRLIFIDETGANTKMARTRGRSKRAARTIDDLWQALTEVIDQFHPWECSGYFRKCGYDHDAV